MTHSEEEALIQLDEAGVSFQPKKRPRIAEIVGIHSLVVAGIVGIGFLWSHFVKV